MSFDDALPFAVQHHIARFRRGEFANRPISDHWRASMTKWVYTFGDGAAEGRAGDRNLLGGKGANLAEMCSLGLPVPPGFTITSEACNWYYANERAFPPQLKA